jgi:hypothetical protein
VENRYVLDRIETPDGAIELVAYREGDDFWVGLARAEGERLGATAPRSGSVASRVTGAVKWFGSWGLGWGVVGPRIVRAEWRNDSGESFPAKIVPLPADLDPEYRAVWGMIGALPMESCDLVGHDDRGLTYDESDPLTSGPLPGDMERFEAIRSQTHDALRYYASAYLKQSGDNRRWIEAALNQAANVMCFFEADSLDGRTVLARRPKIVERYLDDARTNPWSPPKPTTD